MGPSWQQGPPSPLLLLFEPGRYPVAYFPKTDISPDSLQGIEHTTRHPDSVPLDGRQLRLAPGQAVIPHGPDRNLSVGEALPGGKQP